MKKYKIFFGNQSTVTAAAKLNEWLEKNPDIIIHTWQYQQARLGDHSICIEYDKLSEMFPDYKFDL